MTRTRDDANQREPGTHGFAVLSWSTLASIRSPSCASVIFALGNKRFQRSAVCWSQERQQAANSRAVASYRTQTCARIRTHPKRCRAPHSKGAARHKRHCTALDCGAPRRFGCTSGLRQLEYGCIFRPVQSTRLKEARAPLKPIGSGCASSSMPRADRLQRPTRRSLSDALQRSLPALPGSAGRVRARSHQRAPGRQACSAQACAATLA